MIELTLEEKIEIKEIIADKLYIDFCVVKDESYIRNDLGADSLDEIELIMEMEKKFDCDINDALAEEVHTVNDLFMCVEYVLNN